MPTSSMYISLVFNRTEIFGEINVLYVCIGTYNYYLTRVFDILRIL